ncbi:hypothetical protein BD626DRAFT_214249 [Schizophyllum amplum]|uniref:MIT domain-containing protein n=1 Tax=Schizophyllum amplum TaxID=97359 RepID=A0A550CK56_9AGAR|nr:hypothetical protein BD626DRAFT_214249 [Auriculariopsis ampla]
MKTSALPTLLRILIFTQAGPINQPASPLARMYPKIVECAELKKEVLRRRNEWQPVAHFVQKAKSVAGRAMYYEDAHQYEAAITLYETAGFWLTLARRYAKDDESRELVRRKSLEYIERVAMIKEQQKLTEETRQREVEGNGLKCTTYWVAAWVIVLRSVVVVDVLRRKMPGLWMSLYDTRS